MVRSREPGLLMRLLPTNSAETTGASGRQDGGFCFVAGYDGRKSQDCVLLSRASRQRRASRERLLRETAPPGTDTDRFTSI